MKFLKQLGSKLEKNVFKKFSKDWSSGGCLLIYTGVTFLASFIMHYRAKICFSVLLFSHAFQNHHLPNFSKLFFSNTLIPSLHFQIFCFFLSSKSCFVKFRSLFSLLIFCRFAPAILLIALSDRTCMFWLCQSSASLAF